ncbi:MAG: response regulator, partial [Chloroflexota bacterium]|nr:response regulator [Chloroflexota bacterium]
VQLLTDLAYVWLGVAAVRSALRARERVRVDVALVFGALALVVLIQETILLSCQTPLGCVSIPASAAISVVLVLLLPFALLRLLENIADVPRWQMRLAQGALVVLSAAFIVSAPTPPPWLILLIGLDLIVGTAYPAWVFVGRARVTLGITRRRMAAVAWGCGLLALTFIFTFLGVFSPRDQPLLQAAARLSGLISGVCFWAGFFPPKWLSQTWRLPELLEYLRPARLMATAGDHNGVVTEAVALDRLAAATGRTTGARRALLIMVDRMQGDLFLWGAPSARIPRQDGMIGQVLQENRPRVAKLSPEHLPDALAAVFASETLPRTAILVPIPGEDSCLGVLAAFADKGPMFVEDDLEVVSFFAREAAAIVQLRMLRESASELEALREADRLKDEFMAVVSHELRTPLTAISGYADILLRKLSGPLNERQERQVVGVREASRRLLALINDLLDVSRLEAGTLDLHLAAVEPADAIERAVTATRVIAAAKGVQLESRELAPNLPRVRADEERLQQILSNLLINAIKFTPQGGSIWIEANAETSRNDSGHEVVFRVHDTGVGLQPGQAERIWDRFYQVESSATRRFGGAGLGLSIVRRLAELHGGHVEARSEGLDRGSTFEVRLPAALGEHAEPIHRVVPAAALLGSVPSTPGDDYRGEHVLVVEDDPHIATVLRTYLEAERYSVEVATDGHQALLAARTGRPFAITLDISLPKLDGWSVLNALKRDPATASIPVIIISIVDNRDFGILLGATEYLVKPIDHERLQTVLHRLGGPRPARESGPILVVDDDPALRDVLCSALAEDGWRTMTAADGEAALAEIERERPTAMVLDLMMPRVDGFEVLRAVREQPSLRDLPVIVVTARNLTDQDRERLANYAQGVVLKQAMRLDNLLQEIRTALARHRPRAGGPS